MHMPVTERIDDQGHEIYCQGRIETPYYLMRNLTNMPWQCGLCHSIHNGWNYSALFQTMDGSCVCDACAEREAPELFATRMELHWNRTVVPDYTVDDDDIQDETTKEN
jgi:hypothetical protein